MLTPLRRAGHRAHPPDVPRPRPDCRNWSGSVHRAQLTSPLVQLAVRPDQDAASVTVIVTKTPRNGPDVVRQAETARRRRLRPAWL